MRAIRRRRHGFTLVELVMVVMIIGMVSSMAIPRMSRGSVAAADASLAGTLRVVRTSILLFSAEHNGAFPGPSKAQMRDQMLTYSNAAGATSPTKTPPYNYGPYLVSLPPCPVGPNAGSSTVLIDAVNSPPHTSVGSGDGWVYNPVTGEFYANAPGIPQAGMTLVDGMTAVGE